MYTTFIKCSKSFLSSVLVERIFTIDNAITTEIRTIMTDKYCKQIMLLKCNSNLGI